MFLLSSALLPFNERPDKIAGEKTGRPGTAALMNFLSLEMMASRFFSR